MVEKGEFWDGNWVLMARSAPGRLSLRMSAEGGALEKAGLLRIMPCMPAAVMSKRKPSVVGLPKFIMDKRRLSGLPICIWGTLA